MLKVVDFYAELRPRGAHCHCGIRRGDGAQVRAQVEVLRNEMAELKTHNVAQANKIETLSAAQKESNAKLGAIKAAIPAQELASIVSATAIEQCTGESAMAVLQGQHGQCAPGARKSASEASRSPVSSVGDSERAGGYGGYGSKSSAGHGGSKVAPTPPPAGVATGGRLNEFQRTNANLGTKTELRSGAPLLASSQGLGPGLPAGLQDVLDWAAWCWLKTTINLSGVLLVCIMQ